MRWTQRYFHFGIIDRMNIWKQKVYSYSLIVVIFRIFQSDIFQGIFPEPNVDPIIQIANVVKLHGTDETVTRNVFTLKSCAPIGHAEVSCLFEFSFEFDLRTI